GFTRLWPSVATLAFMGESFALLSLAMKSLPMGTSYVVWTGIGAVGAFIVGVVFLGEHLSPLRVLAAVLVLTGLVLVRLGPGGEGACRRRGARPVASGQWPVTAEWLLPHSAPIPSGSRATSHGPRATP